jgi:4a-hydroxytetrahydrobiopterin dehydratase
MGTSDLAGKECVPCKGGVPPLAGDEIARLLAQVDGWSAERDHHITKTIKFPDFVQALATVNGIGEIAEEQGHHPDLYLTWGKVRVEIWTHKIDGLTESDFILAAKIDKALAR